jgi:SAM-dependent methyltransferase
MDVARYLDFARTHKAALLAEPEFAASLQMIALGSSAGTIELSDAYDVLVGEGACALRLIAPMLGPRMRVLEIGGGVGFAHLWLLLEGIEATAFEPSEAGHGGAFHAGRALLAHFKQSDAGWLALDAAAAPSLGKKFDLIFSNNVLEHIADLEGALAAMAQVLAPGGRMRHNCPNYAVPYEPHYGVPLVPLAPRATAWILGSVSREELWRGLNFVTAHRLEAIADRNALELEFDRDHFYNTVARLGTETAFANKHPVLARVFRLLEPSHALTALRWLPPSWLTPMQTTWRGAQPTPGTRP